MKTSKIWDKYGIKEIKKSYTKEVLKIENSKPFKFAGVNYTLDQSVLKEYFDTDNVGR